MRDSSEATAVLIEIRDIVREHLQEYRKVTAEQLAMNRRSLDVLERTATLYRRVVGSLISLAAIVLIFWLLFR